MKTEVLARKKRGRLASRKKKTGRLEAGLTLCEKKKRRLDAGITLCGSRKKSRRFAVTTIEKLGELELEMILLKLPASDLVRCKRVCRAWRSLISSDYFVTAHLNRSRSDPSSHKLLVRSCFLPSKKLAPFKSMVCFSSDYMVTVGSVNGLICFVARLYGENSFLMTPDNIWILNPLTGLCRKLPSPSSYTLITPDTTTSKFVFWCDDADDGVYKVAKIVSYSNGRTIVDLWESTSPDTWTTVNATAPFHFRFQSEDDLTWVHACEVLIEGVAAYWLVYNHLNIMFVLKLDLKTLTLESIPLPKPLNHAGSYVFCGIVNGDFVLLHQGVIHQRSGIYKGSGMYRIWTMDDDGKGSRGWKKIFKVCFDFMFSKFLGIVKGKLVFQFQNNIITLYDLETTRTKEVLSVPQFNKICMRSAHHFVGSLVSLHGFGYEYNDHLKRLMRVDF